MSNRETRKKAANYYTEFSERYDDERRGGYFGFINDLEVKTIKRLASNNKTLEIGCGTGLILERASRVSKESVGVDISGGMISCCEDKKLCAVKINGTHLPFKDEYFDLVYSFKVLPHILDINEMLKEAVRVTKPNGKLVLEYYGKWSFKFLNDSIKFFFLTKPVYLRHDTFKSFCSYVPEGWEVVSRTGIRISGFAAFCYTIPVLSVLFRTVDKYLSTKPIFRDLAGYCVIEFKRK